MSWLFKGTILATIFFAWLWRNHLDIVITLAPKNVDFFILEQMFSREGKNTGLTREPMVSTILPTEGITKENLQDIFHKDGFPTLVKGVLNTDQDLIVGEMTKRNKGKDMRMLTFESWESPHFSPSCGALESSITNSFDDYSTNHLFTNVADNHSYYYAGFEAITDAETVNTMTGLDVEVLGDYKTNNLFTSNFPHEILTASTHCAPIDSFTLQLVGTKTWFFVSPEDLSGVGAIPMPTSFPLPITDDDFISKVKNIYVLRQEPGDAMYFGPHWCHAVSTSKGPNLMMNMRYLSLPKMMGGPFNLFVKMVIRRFISPRGDGVNPQANKLLYPGIYDALTLWYNQGCGETEWFKKLHARVTGGYS